MSTLELDQIAAAEMKRRGAELVGGRGVKAPDFAFATIYRLQQWRDGKLWEVFSGGKFLDAAQSPADLFDA